MTWMECGACKHTFTEGYWTQESLDAVFAKTHPNQKPGADIWASISPIWRFLLA